MAKPGTRVNIAEKLAKVTGHWSPKTVRLATNACPGDSQAAACRGGGSSAPHRLSPWLPLRMAAPTNPAPPSSATPEAVRLVVCCARCPWAFLIHPNQPEASPAPPLQGPFQGLSALSEGLRRDFSPPDAASPRKIGKGLRRRSEALSEAKPQVAADESGCTRYFGHTILGESLDHTTSTLFLVVSVLLILAGSTLPALTKIRNWSADRRNLLRLYPLWHRLTDAVPSVRLDPPRSRTVERLDPRNPHGRLYRRTIEIRDAALALSDHAPAEIRAQAQSYVVASGLIGTQADTAVEACWLEVARRSRLRGEDPTNKHHRPAGGGRDLASEISALSQLSAAYHSDLTHSFAEATDRTRTLETQP